MIKTLFEMSQEGFSVMQELSVTQPVVKPLSSEPLNTKFPNLAYVAHKMKMQAIAVLIVSSTF